jgi:GH15 family glucan-1,4-alpha-glucosidase
VHYEGRRMMLVRAQTAEGDLFDQWSLGLYGIEGKEGTYMDAEDGELSGNGIEHGQVDSVIRLAYYYRPGETKTFYYWMTAGRFFSDVYELNAYVLKKQPRYLMGTAADYWRAWLKSQGVKFAGLPSPIVETFTRSLLVMRAHMDRGGSIIASSDTGKLNQGRDTYAYMWPRDAAYAARALTLAGDLGGAKRFFRFCNSIIDAEGYFMHKYLPDGSLGSSWHPWVRNGVTELPIQADETAIVLVVLKEYYQVSRDIELIEEVFNTLIRRAGDFLSTYVEAKTGLPRPSYDLWEEVYGVSTYTASATYGALRAAEYFADLLGKHDVADQYRGAAERMQKGILTHLYDSSKGLFAKTAFPKGEGEYHFDFTPDFSSLFGVYEFGVLSQDDARFQKTMETMERELQLGEGTIGGMPRNATDQYYRTSPDAPPNPWTVTTLWKAQCALGKAKNKQDLDGVIEALEWVVQHASASGTIAEQVNPYTGDIIGATPLVWSHAEFVTTAIELLQKMDDFGLCDACYPLRRR